MEITLSLCRRVRRVYGIQGKVVRDKWGSSGGRLKLWGSFSKEDEYFDAYHPISRGMLPPAQSVVCDLDHMSV
jgi:hypothetical protein